MRTPRHITLLFLTMALAVSSLIYYPRYFAERAKMRQMAAALSAVSSTPSLGERVKFADCALNGVLPDHECTPGSIFPDATLARICVPGYTKTVRKVSPKLRKKVFAEYGVAYPNPRGSLEVDHLIPLALGGNNDIANLFPEPAEPAPGFREKDIAEIYLQREVCAGRADLGAAQRQVASNWLLIYENLTSEQIQEIKSQFRSWSN